MKRLAIAIALFLIPGAGAAGAGAMLGADVLLQGWSGGKPEAKEPDLNPVPFDSATAARYGEVAAKLAATIATDDAPAFRALHSDSGWAQTDDWWKAMLADQKKGFGRIVRVFGPLRGSIRMGKMGVGVPPNGAAILLHFERGLGASMSFELDEAGKIAKSSLWVQRELATAPPEGTEVLWETKKRGAKK